MHLARVDAERGKGEAKLLVSVGGGDSALRSSLGGGEMEVGFQAYTHLHTVLFLFLSLGS